MSVSSSKTFCVNPWINVRVTHDGNVGICSYSGNVGNLKDAPIEDILNGPIVNEIKECIKHETWHPVCSYCKNAEKHGGRSERLLTNDWGGPETIKLIDSDPSKNYPMSVAVNQSNLCNLSCTYCGPNNSTEWSKKLSIPINLISVESNGILDYLTAHADTITGIMLGGGEPLLQKNTYKILEILQKPDRQLKVAITTNLSVPLENNPVWKTVQHYGESIACNWLISFESIGDKFEYVRNGASWETFKKNIQILTASHQYITAHPAYGIYCAFDLLEYCDFCVENDLKIFWCDIFAPHQLDIRYMPKELRDLAIQNIDAVLAKYKDNPHVLTETLVKYREMAVNGVSFASDGSTDDKVRAREILKFNSGIEQSLKKTTTFEDLWPAIHQQLSTIAND